jgi:hypothetical protein
MGAPTRDVAAPELDHARVGEVEAGDDVDEGRLPCSVGTDEADDLVPVQLERHVTERLHPLEGTGDRGGPENWSGPPAFLRTLFVDQARQIFGTTFAFTVSTTLGTLFCTRITRYCRPNTVCRLFEKLTLPDSVVTFLNFSI